MVQFTEKGIKIGKEEIPFYSGSFHYWRSERKNWEKILTEIKEMGFQIVETYIPWSVHEPEEGVFEFGGTYPERDVEAFLELCRKNKLWVIVRPGPHINAEMPSFGYPEWVLEEENTVKNPWGSEVLYPYITGPFSIPSYNSNIFYQKVRRYFKRLTPILRRHAYPKGNIIAIQADNETCNFFRDNPFILDYSKEAIRDYRAFLKEKYVTIENYNGKLKTAYESFQEIMAPEGYKGRAFLEVQEWIKFKEEQILTALRKIIMLLTEMELNIPIFHNCAYQTYTPISLQRDERIDNLAVAGIDAYPEPGDTKMLKERILFLCGSSRLPYVPEFGSGSWFDRGRVLTPAQEKFGYLYAFMKGLKAINYYMLVERNRWTGCPIRNDGSIRKDYYELFVKLNKFLTENNIFEDCRQPRILLLKNYEMGRIKASAYEYGINLLSSNCLAQGPDIPQTLVRHSIEEPIEADSYWESMEMEKWIEEVMEYLDNRQLAYNISDQYIEEDILNKYDVVFASAYTQMSEHYQRMLLRLARSFSASGQKKKVFIGPFYPKYNEYLEDCSLLQELSCLEIGEQKNTGKLRNGEEIDGWLPQPEIWCDRKGIECAIHKTGRENISHLYVANVMDCTQSAVLTFPLNYQFKGLWEADYSADSANQITVKLAAFQICVIELKEEKNDCF